MEELLSLLNEQTVYQFLLLLARILAFVVFMPVFGHTAINVTVRIAFAFYLSIFIYPFVDIVTSINQNNFIIRIDENGFFSARLPINYPHVCFVRSSIYNGSIFLEPGKEVFQLLGTSNPLFMGESAKINSDMFELMKIRSFDYRDMQSKILDMSPAQYKTYCLNWGEKDMNALDSIMATNTISAKAYQMMKLELKYGAEVNIMSYDMKFIFISRGNFYYNRYFFKNNICIIYQ